MEQNRTIKALSRLGIGVAFVIAAVLIQSGAVFAQVTTSAIAGRTTDGSGNPVAGVTIEAVHVPSGSTYTTTTNSSGFYNIPAVRVGGPYTIKATAAGFNEQTRENIQLGLGTTGTVNFDLSAAIDVEVTVEADDIFNEVRTGPATNINREVVNELPTIARSINDFTRLTPQAGGGGTFAGQDNRLNNITVDGSYFNNSFGLAGQPGQRTGVSPISLDAIEEFQVNVAPYDVRQGNFVGAGVNTVTRSGTNDYKGSVYYIYRTPGLTGKQAGDNTVNVGDFDYRTWGFRVGGPMPFFRFGEGGPGFITGKDKLFFFFSYEDESLSQPNSTIRARNAGETAGGSVSRVLASDLQQLSGFLSTNFGYETGPFQGYNSDTVGKKYLFRGDYNINNNNKLNFRYIQLDSNTDVPLSTSSSLGFGRSRAFSGAMSYQNSNYKILENIRSLVGEWSSVITPTVSNSLLVGYTKQDESRDSVGTFFPFVDILEGGSTYISFGFEPFTPNNELRYNSFQLQNNTSFFLGRHTLTAGLSYENYESENVFFPGSQSAYVFNSLADFYADANDYLANPNRTTSPINLRRFQVRWSNIPGLEKPIQPLEVQYVGFYGQDVWRIRDNFSLTYGLRMDVPFFGETGFTNAQANALNFRDETGATVQYQTQQLPEANILWSPRAGFNWTPFKSAWLQVRGGTGVFTGRPAYVWISNQIGENGILTGFQQLDNTTTRPFNPNPDRYKQPATGLPASSYGLAITNPDFRFPQIWRSTFGFDARLPFGFIGGAEYLYTRDVNGVYYINANLAPANTAFSGVDNRPRWTTSNRINSNITSAIVLKNQDVGKSWNLSFTLERPFSNGLYAKAAYSYGESKNTVDPGSIAFGSWNNNPHPADPNNPGLGYSFASPGHRIFGVVSYRKEYFKFGATSFSMFWETRNGGNSSYTFSGDLNGDGGTSNDLIYIPRDASEMNFEEFTSSGTTFTVAQQQAAWESFIQQDNYLSKNRGGYAQRGAAFLPFETKVDLSVTQEVFLKAFGRTHRFQVRGDVLNFGNLLNENWGVGNNFTSTQPLIARGADADGRARYRLRNIGSSLVSSPYTPSAGLGDVYRVQLTFRYIFD